MRIEDLKLDSTRRYTVDVHGKIYPVKKQRGRYYIQHSKGQLTVTSLFKKEIEIDGSLADYVLNGWFQIYSSYELYRSFISAELSWLNYK